MNSPERSAHRGPRWAPWVTKKDRVKRGAKRPRLLPWTLTPHGKFQCRTSDSIA
ncbi:MAG: hypothetical protein CBARDMAM_0793 [uncultured Caballeronia sp.]|nr:MAG: hypothetical protein CBARDMAM_0793 [uncultured Caballeronia sp.]